MRKILFPVPILYIGLRYTFPPEPTDDGILDLTEDEQPFYYNSHSGELSLEFPRAENVCRGGILADG